MSLDAAGLLRGVIGAVGTSDLLAELLSYARDHPAQTATATAAASTGLVALLWHLRWATGLAPLFTRLVGRDMAAHPKRARILEALATRALSTRELLEATRLNAGTTLHHLRHLRRAGLVATRKEGRERLWELPGARLPGAPKATRVPARQAILLLLSTSAPLSQAQLARALGCTRANVHHHVRVLARDGLVETRRAGLRTLCVLAAA